MPPRPIFLNRRRLPRLSVVLAAATLGLAGGAALVLAGRAFLAVACGA